MAKRTLMPEQKQLIDSIFRHQQPATIAELQDVLKEMFAPMMEEMLKGELDAHLGYEKHDQSPKATTNRRNGSYPKTVRSTMGEIELNIPRDRNGEFEPALIPTGERDISAIEDKVFSMYAKGLSDRDISETIDEIYGFKLSHETISRIVDRVQPQLTEWQSRSLSECYSFMYVDALVVSVKSEGRSINKSVYTIIGVDVNGLKDCLGFWISDNEGAHFWITIFDELKMRGVKKIGFVSIDGLAGLEDGIKSVFPDAVVQRCIVHLIRNSVKYIPSKHYKAFCSDLKSIYGAVSIAAANAALESLRQKWKDYPSAIKVWDDVYRHIEQLFEYPSEIRKIIYTTNAVESFNSALRKVTNRKAAFPNDSAVFKILYLRTLDISKRWTKPMANWAVVRGKLDIFMPGWDKS